MRHKNSRDKRIKNIPAWIFTGLFFVLFPVYLELTLHFFIYHSASLRIVLPVLFGGAGGFLFWLICSLFPKKVNRVLAVAVVSLVSLYFEIQLAYHSIFSEFMSLWQVSFGATAITNFWKPMVYGLLQIIPQILALLVPVVVLIILLCRGKLYFEPVRGVYFLLPIVGALLLHGTAVGLMIWRESDQTPIYRMYQSSSTGSEDSIQNFGLLATTRLEGTYLLLPEAEEPGDSVYDYDENAPLVNYDPDKYNVMNIDFDALIAETEDPALVTLDSVIRRLVPTEKNEYTGLLKGYNLITLCCESFSPYVISEELTPALYKLSTEGFVFENYFGCFASNTTNGEYTMNMGLFPDMSRKKSASSFYASQDHYIPFCLGNEFSAIGAQTYAYHNYSSTYYTRNVTHPNMGYTFRAADTGLDMALKWPSSDLEMMEKSVDDYLASGEQFCAYYMTFSGHYHYNWDNAMSVKNRAVVEDMPYSDTVKAYIACNLELEYALEYLMDRLEEAGVADKTVIALTNDHYPYGLSEEEYNELAGKPIDTEFERYRNSFILYVPGMEVHVPTYCSTVDILPTLLNLFGFEYDSRLLTGKDILAPNAVHMAILSNQRYITPEFAYVPRGEIRSFNGETPDPELVSRLQKEVSTRFQLSSDILNLDYYSHVLLGATESGSAFQLYTYKDLPVVFDVNSLTYFLDHNYLQPKSETQFGFYDPCTMMEYLRILYLMDGNESENPEDIISWATENGIILEDELDMVRENVDCIRKVTARILYRFAGYNGIDRTLSRDYSEDYLLSSCELTQEEQDALAWCYESAIMLGTGNVLSNFHAGDKNMTRYYVINIIYRYIGAFVKE